MNCCPTCGLVDKSFRGCNKLKRCKTNKKYGCVGCYKRDPCRNKFHTEADLWLNNNVRKNKKYHDKDGIFEYIERNDGVDEKGGIIRTRKTKQGMLLYSPFNNDIAHIWLGKTFFRITKKGTIIEVKNKDE